MALGLQVEAALLLGTLVGAVSELAPLAEVVSVPEPA